MTVSFLRVHKRMRYKNRCFQNVFLCFCAFPCIALHRQNGLIYLNLQKVVELLTSGRKGLRGAELKVPQLILCSEKTKQQQLQRDQEKRKQGSVFFTSKSEACALCLQSPLR